MKKNAVIIAGYYGFGNAGDELLLRVLVDQSREQDPQCRIIVLSQNPEQTQRHFGVEAVHRWKAWQWLGPFLVAKRFILGGGGLLQEATGPWNHLYYLSLVLLATLCGCRTEIKAIGVDPIQLAPNRWLTGFVFNRLANVISVRDADSQHALLAAGVFRPVLRTTDLVFQIALPQAAKQGDRVAIAAAPWLQRPGWDQDLAILADRMSDQLKLSVDFLVFYPEEDEEICQQAAQRAQSPVRVRRWQNPEDLLAWISEYSLLFGMRYHALVLAALAGKAFVGWGYQRKVYSICRDFGQPLWTFERGWDADAVFRQASDAWRHRLILPERYRARLAEWRKSAPAAHSMAMIFPSQV